MTENFLSSHLTLDKINQLDVLRIQNKAASAVIAVQGAHIFEFTPTEGHNLLFVSEAENFETGKAIRGGIPICWPWFGAHKEVKEATAHGFVRNQPWQYKLVHDSENRTDIKFWFETSGTDVGFEHQARVELLVSIGDTLQVSLTTHNLDTHPFIISQALHSYFNCQNISDVRIFGIEGFRYLDSVTQKSNCVPNDFSFDREIDWIVIDQGQAIELSGLAQPSIRLSRSGSRSLVIWNPWIEKSKTLSQFHKFDYKKMFCLETTNISEDSRLVKPNASHLMKMELTTVNSNEPH
ncbi:MAG: D-hexose-6-phosphate mutarotase [Gammaproteobacteria bacterium]|nr:D-hexose-6-phosphate mutarotase [Gammaproteobacteria bacterium]